MPFQDIEDDATPAPRTPTLLERWARKILFEDWSLKLVAIVVTVVLWLAVTGQNQPVTQRSAVQLNFLRPAGVEISNELPGNVEVMLTGSPAKLEEIGPRLVATIDITDQKPGERVVRLLDRVQMVLPPGVTIQSFRPATVPIRLEPIVETQLEVEVKVEGKLPDGYEIRGFAINPQRVRLRGPSDRIRALQKAMTESVSLDGRRETFSLSNVAISVPDPKIEILDPTVDVRVEIAETKRGEVHQRLFIDASPYVALILTSAHRL
jgi:YbbR domain-containing protein